MKIRTTALAAITLTTFAAASQAQARITVPMHVVTETGIGAPIGEIKASESPYSVVFTPALSGLVPGVHGFHLHENPNCDSKEKDGKRVAGLGAGPHYDPKKTNRHGTPWGTGHLGDLPPLYVTADGRAIHPLLAPRLNLADVKGRSLMIHAGGDNHADHPAILGGGGARVACGTSM